MEIQELPQLHPGFAIIRHDIIGERIVDVLESCGIVDSAQPGGVSFTRKALSSGVGAPNVLEELSIEEKDIKARSRKSREAETKLVADSLLAITAGIRHELDRFKIIPKDSKTTQDKEANGKLNQFIPHRLYSLSAFLKGAILECGLIGFSTLDKLIDKYFETRKWLNKM